MTSFARVLLLLPIGLALAAQPETHPATVEGMVTDSATGAPIPSATVVASGPGTTPPALSGEDGRYSLTIPPGSYGIFARKDGYGRGLSIPPRHVRLSPGQRLAGIDLKLDKEAVLAGRVLDSAKQPVSGVRITAWVRSYSNGRLMFGSAGSARTDDLGEFRLAGLSPRVYYLSATPTTARFRVRTARREESREPVRATVRGFYLNAPSFDAATPVTLGRGEQTEGFDLVLPRVETYCVAGSVAGAGGETVNLGLSEIAPGWDSFLVFGVIREGQEFEYCGLPRGTFTFTAITSTADGIPTRFVHAAVVITNRDIELGRLTLMDGAKIEGRVEVSGIEPEKADLKGLQIGLRPSTRLAYLKEAPAVSIGKPGPFSLANVFTDQYWLETRTPSGYYLKHADCGPRNALRETIHAGCGELRVTLGADAASVSVQVTDKDNQPFSNAVVVLSPANLPPDIPPDTLRHRATDQSGTLEFNSLAPGKYRVLAFGHINPNEATNPDFVRRWLSKGTELELKPREKASLSLPPSGTPQER